MELEIDELLGLPAHPLIVHGVIALVPAAALLTVVAVVWPAARRRIGWLGVLVAVAAVGSVWAAEGSGKKLEDRVEETALVEDHTDLGEQLLVPTIVLLAGAVLVTVVGRRDDHVARVEVAGPGAYGTRGASAIGAAVAVVALAASGFAVVQVFRVGHSGAKAVWDDTGSADDGGDDSGRGRGRGRGGDDGESLGIPGARVPQG